MWKFHSWSLKSEASRIGTLAKACPLNNSQSSKSLEPYENGYFFFITIFVRFFFYLFIWPESNNYFPSNTPIKFFMCKFYEWQIKTEAKTIHGEKKQSPMEIDNKKTKQMGRKKMYLRMHTRAHKIYTRIIRYTIFFILVGRFSGDVSYRDCTIKTKRGKQDSLRLRICYSPSKPRKNESIFCWSS